MVYIIPSATYRTSTIKNPQFKWRCNDDPFLRPIPSTSILSVTIPSTTPALCHPSTISFIRPFTRYVRHVLIRIIISCFCEAFISACLPRIMSNLFTVGVGLKVFVPRKMFFASLFGSLGSCLPSVGDALEYGKWKIAGILVWCHVSSYRFSSQVH